MRPSSEDDAIERCMHKAKFRAECGRAANTTYSKVIFIIIIRKLHIK